MSFHIDRVPSLSKMRVLLANRVRSKHAPISPLAGYCRADCVGVRLICWGLVALLAISIGNVGDSFADEIRLIRGGSYKGQVIKEPSENNGFYEFKLENGGILKIAKNEVDKVARPQSSNASYREELAKHDVSTAEGNLAIAEWCQKNDLRVLREKHLRKVVEIDPNNTKARRHLGYTRHVLTGKWVVRDEYFHSIGYVGRGTTMRLPAAVIVEAENKKHRDAVIQWKGKIPRLIKLLKNPRRFAEAKTELEEIDDVKAIPVLIDIYSKTGKRGSAVEFDRDVKSLLMSIVAKMDILSAKSFLVQVAMFERDDVLQDEAAQILKKKYPQWTADYLIARLNSIPATIHSMTDERAVVRDRDFIARAAVILRELEADTSESILPLINLISINRILPPAASPKKGGLGGASFGKDGSVAMNQGGEKPKARPVNIRIEQARVALIGMTEQRFDYNKAAWLSWYLNRTLPQVIDLRRMD